jgi:uncharacterized metal-binding protein
MDNFTDNFTKEQMLKWVEEYKKNNNGKYPSVRADLLNKEINNLTKEQILKWVEEYKKDNGKYPTCESGNIKETKI